MLTPDFYLASIKKFRPDFGWQELLRMKSLEALDLDAIGHILELPANWRLQAEEWWKRQSELSQVLWCFHPDYPPELLKLEQPPLFLFVQGDLKRNPLPRVAVVGSREVSPDVLWWMDLELAKFLKASPHVIVSGGARGVDQKAHFLALRSQCPTWVLLPGGLDRLYPSTWDGWRTEFLKAGGCLITEYEAGVQMRNYHFVRRNQLIVALSNYCFILQAARRSGTFLTARMAQKSGLPLAALPHFPRYPKGLSCLDLIADGATLIRDARDLRVWTSIARSSPAE